MLTPDKDGESAEAWIAAGIVRARMFADSPPRIDRFEVVRRIGDGAFGVVYEARDPELDRVVAIKLVVRGHGCAPHDDRLREARAMARVSHPALAAVHDVGLWRGLPYLVMEMVSGQALLRWSERTNPNSAQRLSVLRQVADGIAAAHAAGMIHRDVKPDNIVVSAAGEAKLLDFGVAALQPTELPGATVNLDHGESHTLPGRGTPRYMAPEQLLGHGVSPRSDQYAFAATAYELLVGHLPPRDPDTGAHRTSDADRSAMPRATWAALSRALAANPSDRFDDLRAVRAALAPRRRRVWIGAAITAVAVTVGASIAWAVTQPRCDEPLVVQTLRTDGVPAPLRRGVRLHHPEPDAQLAKLDAVAREAGQQWSAAIEQACPVPAARACYERERIGLEELVAAMDTGPIEQWAGLSMLVFELGPPSVCAEESGPISMKPEGRVRERSLARAWIAERLGDTSAAITLGEQLLADDSLSEDQRMRTLIVVAQAHLASGAMRQAELLLDESLQLAKQGGRDRHAIQTMLGLSSVYLQQGRHPENEALLVATQVLVNRTPGQVGEDARINVAVAEARALLAQGRSEQAVRVLAPWRSRSADDSGNALLVHTTLANALSESGQHRASATQYEATIEAFADRFGGTNLRSAMTRYNAAMSWFYAGELQRATDGVTRAWNDLRTLGLQDAPMGWLVRELRATLRYYAGDLHFALAERRTLFALRTSHPEATLHDEHLARLQLAQVLTDSGQAGEAIETLQPLTPDAWAGDAIGATRALAIIELARAYRSAGQLDEVPGLLAGVEHWVQRGEMSECEILVPLAIERCVYMRSVGDEASAAKAWQQATECPSTAWHVRRQTLRRRCDDPIPTAN